MSSALSLCCAYKFQKVRGSKILLSKPVKKSKNRLRNELVISLHVSKVTNIFFTVRNSHYEYLIFNIKANTQSVTQLNENFNNSNFTIKQCKQLFNIQNRK